MNFGQALDALKKGERVARAGWNGKGMWVILVQGGDYSLDTVAHTSWTGLLPWIGMKTAGDEFVPWLASQTDILAEDWSVVG